MPEPKQGNANRNQEQNPDDNLSASAGISMMKKILFILGGILIIIIVGIVGIAGGVGGAYIFGKIQQSPVAQDAAVESEDQSEAEAEEAPVAEVVEEKRDAIYFEIRPSFVVNIGSTTRTRFLQIDVVVMGYEEVDMKALEQHIPAVRNDLLLLFSNQDAEALLTPEGKNMLREKSLEVVRVAMKNKYGKPAVEDIFFTKLVVQ